MRLVIQRVNSASVSVGNKKISEISRGLFILLGVQNGDTKKDVDFLASKLVKLRIMSDKADKMNLSIAEKHSEVLVVSQFTLLADTRKGNRPSFIKAANPDLARDLYNYFVSSLIEKGIKTQTGRFGEYMTIICSLDGPVTIVLDSKNFIS